MVQRMQDLEEAQRWKRKFLDALEDHEEREKLLTARIRLLRRGLLGLSLAGDGLDSRLDKQLSDLRSSLRHDDRETGLELLLEQIEQSIVRLDDEKNASNWALQQAFTSCLSELAHLQLPGSTRRQLKKFAANLPIRLKDPQQHAGLIRQFMELLKEIIQVMQAREQSAESAQATKTGFWQRLFATDSGNPAPENTPSKSIPEEVSEGSHIARIFKPEPATEIKSHSQDIDNNIGETDQRQQTANEEDSIPLEVSDASGRVINASMTSHTEPLSERQAASDDSSDVDALDLQSDQESVDIEELDAITLEGELIRDRSGLAEPAFSFIAGHVEPLLLRILESIHITGESVTLAESIRRNVVKGLNWYDFVAVLEQILQILRNAADEQRAEFQGFLSEVTESLAQVQAFMDSTRRYSKEASESDAAMDASVREQIDGIKTAVENSGDDIQSLKESVQSQIGAIIKSLDGFKLQRSRQDESMTGEVHQLIDRIAALETESRELRLNLSRQQETALKDSLTELPNREAYNQRLKLLLETWRPFADDDSQDGRTLCLAVADVDYFKNINDSYGHLAGDKVLKIIARELVSRLREKDFIARYGGEEFVVIMPDTRPADAEHVLNKLRQAVAAIPFHFKERQIQITLSFGVVAAQPTDSVETLFERADRALYIAKA
ncbi:MAG: GGDEF domain-containing protein, partial [Gammaproteobacteria bacterium]|nr:GGDEF domain-containing protein [Gammaproteobacteria bacterium]